MEVSNVINSQYCAHVRSDIRLNCKGTDFHYRLSQETDLYHCLSFSYNVNAFSKRSNKKELPVNAFYSGSAH